MSLAEITNTKPGIFKTKLILYRANGLVGRFTDALAIRNDVLKMGTDWGNHIYQLGDIEYYDTAFHYNKMSLTEERLLNTEKAAKLGKNRSVLRYVHYIRGAWLINRYEWYLAEKNLLEVLRLTRGSGIKDVTSEAALALVKFHLGKLSDPIQEAEYLGAFRNESAHYYLALLWQAIGDLAQAKHHALAAYRYAWADGEPYVRRYELNQATALLNELQVPIPDLPPYDPAKEEPFPWEAEVEAVIEKLKAEKAAEETGKKEE